MQRGRMTLPLPSRPLPWYPWLPPRPRPQKFTNPRPPPPPPPRPWTWYPWTQWPPATCWVVDAARKWLVPDKPVFFCVINVLNMLTVTSKSVLSVVLAHILAFMVSMAYVLIQFTRCFTLDQASSPGCLEAVRFSRRIPRKNVTNC